MSAAQPNLPGNGVTLRIRRDDGVTLAGVTVSPERYQPGPLHAALAAATGLSAAEIGRVFSAVPAFPRQPREPSTEGRGWLVIDFPPTRQFYLLRDDGTHLSWTAMAQHFTMLRAVTAIGAIAGLSVTEMARLAGAQGGGAVTPSEPYGPDCIVNGDFALAGPPPTLFNGAVISGGALILDGGGDQRAEWTSAQTLTAGTYRWRMTVTGGDPEGQLRLGLGQPFVTGVFLDVYGPGVYEGTAIWAGSSQTIFLRGPQIPEIIVNLDNFQVNRVN